VEIPRAIGKYEILERIGKGGFGVVYKGRDPFIKRLVAVKVCTSADETLKRRFLREAEIAGNLHHRNIVTVFEFGYDEAGPFLVQEYLDGEDLEAKIRRLEPIPQDVRLGYLLQIARALEYAHKKGILHRDVKPANVRVLHDDRIKILDFGIAKLSGAETQLTRSGRILGTAGYLSPEQIRGEAVDARSDVFAFGVLAYELLCYVHPFPGTTISELLHQVVRTEAQPLASLCPACPPEITAMVTRCMEKDPGRRYDGFPEAAEALASVLAGLRSAPADEGGPAADEEPAEATLEPEPDASAMPTVAIAETDLPAPPPPPPLALPGVPSTIPPPSPLAPPAPPARSAEDEDLGATREIPVVPPGRARRWTVAGAVLAGCVLLALGIAWNGWRRAAEPVPVREAAARTASPAAEAAAPDTGRLVLDAVPWGEVVRVIDDEGHAVPLPQERSTPLVLSLPAGRYTAELRHPDAAAPTSCHADLAAGETAVCAAELDRIETLDYFREAGWWR
jgi:serine/threonine protein kinase